MRIDPVEDVGMMNEVSASLVLPMPIDGEAPLFAG